LGVASATLLVFALIPAVPDPILEAHASDAGRTGLALAA
jgi:hypothetical protein